MCSSDLTQSGSELVEQPSALVASDSHANVLCNGGNSGSVTVTFSGGTAPYQVSFNGGAFAAATSPAVYSSLTAGTYTWTVKDANNCTQSGSEVVAEPTALVASDNHANVLCNGGNTGSVSVTFSGGTAPYMVSFNGGAFAAATSPAVYSSLTAGTYTWTVKDANECMVEGSEVVEEPTALEADHSHVNVTCNGRSDGSVSVSVIGGTAPYTIVINGSSYTGASATLTGLAAETYNWTVTDANGCTTEGSETITQPDSLKVSLSVLPNCVVICGGTASASATGGTSPYSFQWTVYTTPQLTNAPNLSGICLQADSIYVKVLVTDQNGCNVSEDYFDIPGCTPPQCDTLRTYTQGGWGAVPQGNNPGTYLHAKIGRAHV